LYASELLQGEPRRIRGNGWGNIVSWPKLVDKKEKQPLRRVQLQEKGEDKTSKIVTEKGTRGTAFPRSNVKGKTAWTR